MEKALYFKLTYDNGLAQAWIWFGSSVQANACDWFQLGLGRLKSNQFGQSDLGISLVRVWKQPTSYAETEQFEREI